MLVYGEYTQKRDMRGVGVVGGSLLTGNSQSFIVGFMLDWNVLHVIGSWQTKPCFPPLERTTN